MATHSEAASTELQDCGNEILFREKPSLLALPAETRCTIYEHLVEFTGTVSIFSQYELARNVSCQTIDLLHVCQLMRAEVKDYFYANQTFELRSAAALDNFVIKIGPYHASTIRHLQIGQWLSSRAASGFVHIFDTNVGPFKSLERLTFPYPSRKYLRRGWDPVRIRHKFDAGPLLMALVRASEFVASCKIYYMETNPSYHKYQGQLMFVPKSETLPDEVRTLHKDHKYVQTWHHYEIPIPEDLHVDEPATEPVPHSSSILYDFTLDDTSSLDSDDADIGDEDVSSDYDPDL